MVTGLSGAAEKVARLYSRRGLCEQPVEEGEYALSWTRLSCTRYMAHQVRLALFGSAHNLGDFLRRLAPPREISRWSLSSVHLKLIKMGVKVINRSRRTVFRMAEAAVPGGLFAGVLSRIRSLAAAPA